MQKTKAIAIKKIISGYSLAAMLCAQTWIANAQNISPNDSVFQQTTEPTDTIKPISQQFEKLNKAFIVNGVKDGLAIVTSPVHWKSRDWIKFSAFAGGVGGLMALDKNIKSVFQNNQNNFTGSLAQVVEPVGDIYGIFVFPAIYVSGLALKSPHIESIGLRGSKAMAISTLICFAGKNIIRRQRPDASASPFNYALPFSKVDYHSFPSAHATIAFTMATAFVMEFPDKKWIAPVAYTLASLTGISRIYNNRHWASDVLVGAALGHFVTKAVYNREIKKHKVAPTFM